MTTEDTHGDGALDASTPPATTEAAAAASEPAIVLDEELWTLDELGEFAVDCMHDARERVNVAEEAIAACRGDLSKYVVPAQADPRYFAAVSSAASAIVTNAYLARLVPAFERFAAAADRAEADDERRADARDGKMDQLLQAMLSTAPPPRFVPMTPDRTGPDPLDPELIQRVMNWWFANHVSYGDGVALSTLSSDELYAKLREVLVDIVPDEDLPADDPPGGGPDLPDDGTAPVPAPPAVREDAAPDAVAGA